ncbi:MMPL family transporter [Lederbergia wuyishanensis]|uniref:RND superfamily putative drug exporter n=1 Tax=Lederbergia wuyishanensis TaxID=1347903 RepID=A0ABU0D9R6_9BACI|nr:MMPL family transporter [Lederbergia wuyishanensis]MCJ8008426.1 MMPL family transporter [Lederbergia wuyishanensis]MDQ0345168.1 RND superfamily putative drug exporter [Lederbergia wuyishanensis]
MNKLGEITFKYRKLVLTIWSFVFLFSGFFALKLPSVLGGSGFEYDGSYKEVEKIMDEDFNIPASSLILLFEKSNDATEQDFKEYIEDTLTRIKEVKNVEIQQASPQIKDDRAFIILSFNNKYQMSQNIENVRGKLKDDNTFSVGLTGRAVIEEDMNQAAQQDLVRAELIGIPIALIILLLAFRGVIAALIPLITGFVSVVVAMGMLYFTGQKIDLSIFVLNTAPMIGLALGIDFALLFVNRFREELDMKATDAAIAKSVATSGRAILFSGFCVLLGLIGMLFIQVGVFQSVAIGGIAVVFTSVLAANTFLPALLSVIGPHINKWMILKNSNGKESSWHTFARYVMKRPVLMALVATIILITGLLPVSDMRLAIPEADALPTSYESRTAFEKYKETFGDTEKTIVYIVTKSNEDMTEKDSLEKLENVVNEIKTDPLTVEVDSIFSATQMSADELIAASKVPELQSQLVPAFEKLTNGKEALLQVKLNAKNSSPKAKDWVRDWEKRKTDLSLKVGGESKFHQEIFDEIINKIVYSLAFILISTYIVLFIAFRSVLIPLKAILMNVLSLGCTFGIIVWLFQEGHLGFHQSDIALMIPVFAFSIVFGLSMDYEVFLISRIYEIYLETGDNDKATLEGLISTSKIITSAAAIMIVITGAFGFTGIIPVQQMGVTIALAIFIDATIVRMVLVPSLMKLLGDVNWWSPFHKRHRVRQYG